MQRNKDAVKPKDLHFIIMPQSFYVKDKICLVSGANRGIGLAILEGLLRHGASKVYAAVRTLSSVDQLVIKYGCDRVVPLKLDKSDPTSIREAANVAQDVQCVVNNAGILVLAEPFANGGDEAKNDEFVDALQNQMDVNVMGLVRMAQAFTPILEKNGGGAFVVINSASSMRCPGSASGRSGATFTGYAASKAASYVITQGLRASLPNTVVVSVHPGPIATDMVDQYGAKGRSETPDIVPEAIVKALREGTFLVYPDAAAQRIGDAYANFADAIILPETTPPVPRHPDVLVDIAPGAPQFPPDDPEVLRKLMSGPMTLEPYDEDRLK